MKLVIDTNIIISAIIKSGLTRNIIINKNIALLTPDYTIKEIEKHQKYICNKIGISEDDVEVLISFIFENIEIIPLEEYKGNLNKAEEIMKKIDIADIPFIAVAISKKADGIWSDDEHFQKQNKIKIFKTEDLTKFL